MPLPSGLQGALATHPAAMLLRLGWQQLMLTTGAIVSALGYVVFQLPYDIAAGGVTGLGIIYNKTGFPLSQSYLFTDLAIIALAGMVFNLETALLAVLTLILVGLFSDFVLEGPSQMRTLMIITEKPDPIRHAIMYELQRGVTHWMVTGGYSQKKRTLLYFTALRSRIYDIKYIIARIDPEAFMVVGVSQQTWGGYNAPKIDQQ
ncbi:MAG: YitT family protein [Desulfobacterales bacterium]